jgi:hypothetical protein
MQLTVPDLTDPETARTVMATVRTLDPAAKLAVDITRRQLHAGGRLTASAAIDALAAAGFRARLSSSGAVASAAAPTMPRCQCGCALGVPCRCG